MKIVIPTNNKKGLSDSIAEHFGRCRTYTFLDEKGKVIEIIDNTSEHMGGVGVPPKLMKKHGAEILLCKGLGLRAIELFKNLGIKVYVYNTSTVKEIFDLWKNKKLIEAGAEDACSDHK